MTRHRVKMPGEDIAIVGYDNIDFAARPPPPLHLHLRQPRQQLGPTAARITARRGGLRRRPPAPAGDLRAGTDRPPVHHLPIGQSGRPGGRRPSARGPVPCPFCFFFSPAYSRGQADLGESVRRAVTSARRQVRSTRPPGRTAHRTSVPGEDEQFKAEAVEAAQTTHSARPSRPRARSGQARPCGRAPGGADARRHPRNGSTWRPGTPRPGTRGCPPPVNSTDPMVHPSAR